MTLRRHLAALSLALLSATGLTGCATREQPAPPPAPAAEFPVTLSGPDGRQVTVDKRPARVVSLSPAATETLFAIGAGSQVVAVDDQSDHPAQAPRTQLSGFKPSVEAIAGYNPDLVVFASDLNGVVGGLSGLRVPVLLLPPAKDLDDAYAQWTLLGRATGHQAEAQDVVRRTREEIGKIVADTPKPARALKYYHEVGPDLYTATSATFVGRVYGLFGLSNVADPADTPSSGGFPQLGEQALFEADPDLIFLADAKCCAQNADTVKARPRWSTLTAVREGRIVPLDDDVASRWAPRIVELVRTVGTTVAEAQRAGR